MAISTDIYTLYAPYPAFTPATATLTLVGATGLAPLTAAGQVDVNMLIMEPSDLIELGVYVVVGTGAAALAVTVSKSQITIGTLLGDSVARPVCVLTGPAAGLTAGQVLRRYKDGSPPNTGAVSSSLNCQPIVGQPPPPLRHDLWSFERGDILHFLVTTPAAIGSGSTGLYFARFQRRGQAQSNRKTLVVGVPNTAYTETPVDIDSTT